LGKRSFAAGVGAFVGFVSRMSSQVSEEAEHAFMNRSAFNPFLLIAASEYLMVFLDAVFHAEVVHDEVFALWHMPFELEHICVKLRPMNSCHFKFRRNIVFYYELLIENFIHLLKLEGIYVATALRLVGI
jgi:hypothetical protein